MNKILSFIRTLYTRVLYFLKGLGTKRKWVAIALGVIIIGGTGYAFLGPKSTSDTEPTGEQFSVVELFPVDTYAQNAGNLIRSTDSETVLRAEAAGKIIRILSIGTRVSSGTTVAQFENSSQRAALLQAEGSLEAAQASFQKTQGGPRSEKLAVLQATHESAQSGVVTTLLSAYAAVDSAVRDTADQMFSNAEGTTPILSFSSSNQQRRINAESQRALLNLILDREAQASNSISNNSNLESELTKTENEVRQAREFMDELIANLNEAIPTGNVTTTTISSYKSAATSARTALTASLSAIASARASLETAKQNLDEGLTGAEDSDLAAASASVKQAQGAYNAALASYGKTIVSAPVSGTVVSCSTSLGDVIGLGSDVCRIRVATVASGDTFLLPLSSVKYAPTGAFVFIVSADSTLEAVKVSTGLVTASGITVTDLFGDEYVVYDVRGLKAGEKVRIQSDSQ